MLISEIPFKKVRELAEHYAQTMPLALDGGDKDDLGEAFTWSDSPEDHYFWSLIYRRQWGRAKHLRPGLFAEEEEQPAKTANQIVPMHMPPLPSKWIYTGEYRRPHKGEFILINGKVRASRGQEMAYPIVVREAEND